MVQKVNDHKNRFLVQFTNKFIISITYKKLRDIPKLFVTIKWLESFPLGYRMGPNRSQLRTGFGEKGEKQSELASTSDRFLVKRRKAVRTGANFGQVLGEKEKSSPNRSQLRTGFAGKGKK
ncbi:hypothetical protein J2S25_002977 [Mesobacillus stamsii]|uniref:Uncharacterized protein n=1 Tax=Mesobacillus stamsii TaxID=225347 RepID=A0ABU0FXV5_9BACI|nr:hypothetical protein [Mesobacillus stamsii]